MVLDRKANFFLAKTKKHMCWETIRPNSKKMGFLVFPRKKLVFHAETNFVGRKTNFFLAENGFGLKTNFFLVVFLWFSLGKSWFSGPKPSFSWEKVGVSARNHLFPRKTWYFTPRHLFGSKECAFHLLFVRVAK